MTESRENKDKRLIFLTLSAQHLLKNYFVDAYKKKGVQITPANTGILFLLLEGEKSMNDLSRLLHVKNPTVTGLIDRLEAKRFVERVSDPGDRRSWKIRITEMGKKELEKTRAIIQKINDDIADGFTEAEIASFTKVLKAMINKFQPS